MIRRISQNTAEALEWKAKEKEAAANKRAAQRKAELYPAFEEERTAVDQAVTKAGAKIDRTLAGIIKPHENPDAGLEEIAKLGQDK